MHIIGNAEKAREEQFVASGVLSTGDTVIVNVDGTVSAAGDAPVSQAIGNPVVFESAVSDFISATFDSSSNKVVIAYTDDTNLGYGTAVVGTVSGTAISFGSPVVFESGYATKTSCVFDTNLNKIVVVYRDNDNSSFGTAVVGTVSGTSISFGTPVVFESANSTDFKATFDSNSNKVVVVYKDLGNSSYGTAIVGTVSGTSISFGSAAVFESASTADIGIAFDSSSNKVVIGYQDGGNSQYGTAIVGTVSGTSISFGSAAVFESAEVSGTSLAFDSANNKVVIAYRDHGNLNYGTAIVGTVSGTSISFGSAAVFESATTTQISAAFDSASNKVVVAYVDSGNSNHGTVVVGTVSGTSISFETPVVFESASTSYVGSTFDSNSNRVVLAYKDVGNSNYGTSIVFRNAGTEPNLTSDNYIGTAATGAPDGQGAKINIKGAVADIPVAYYDIASASYDSVSFSVNSPAASPRETMFNTDGTKMYVLDNGNDSVYQFSLSTGFDLSTASYDSVSFSVTSQASNPQGFNFNNDGTKMYVVGEDNDTVYQYSLSTGFDLSTASYDSVSFSVASQEATPTAVVFNKDGTKMYVVGEISDAVHQYSLSTGFDLSTASYDSVSFDYSAQATIVLSMAFSNDGTKMFLSDAATDFIYQYSLSTAFDVSTSSYASVSLNVSSQDANPHGIVFSSTGDKLYVTGWSSDTVYQYSTSVSLIAGQSYYVQTDGTLGTTPADPSVFAGTAVAATKLIVKG